MFVHMHNNNCVYMQVIVIVFVCIILEPPLLFIIMICFCALFCTFTIGDTFVIVYTAHCGNCSFVFSLPVDQNTILP